MSTVNSSLSKNENPTKGENQDVLTSVFHCDSFVVKKISYEGITVLSFEGINSNRLRKELEKFALHAKGDIGIDFSKLTGLQPSIVSVLKGIQRRIQQRKKLLFLCNPPEKLIDLLKLAGQLEHFQITKDSDSRPQAPTQTKKKAAPQKKRRAATTKRPTKQKIAHLTQSLKRTEDLERGLDSASECVRRFLPKKSPICEGYTFSFASEACDKIGGDFFDFFPLENGELGITIGDVSGHGIDSAIIMGMTKKVLRLRGRELYDRTPAEVLTQVNSDLFEDLGRKLFVTALYAKLNLKTGEFAFARAGHEPPLLVKLGANTAPLSIHSEGIALGMAPEKIFSNVIEDCCLLLNEGNSLFLYTDGIVEAWNERRDLFSRDRLNYVLEKTPAGASAEEILDGLQSAVSKFCGDTPSEDDQTALVIVRT